MVVTWFAPKRRGAEVKRELYKIEPRPALLPEHEPLLDVQLMRFLKEHGPNAGKIVGCFRRALEWRQKALPPGIPQTEDPLGWLSASEMVHGEWATKYAYIGIHCGKSKIGCPVKIERLGRYDLAGLQESDPEFRKKFNQFYLSLIEFLQQRLDRLSLEEGRLVQTYEVFDMSGECREQSTHTSSRAHTQASHHTRTAPPLLYRPRLPHDDDDRDQLYKGHITQLLGPLSLVIP